MCIVKPIICVNCLEQNKCTIMYLDSKYVKYSDDSSFMNKNKLSIILILKWRRQYCFLASRSPPILQAT